MTTDNDDQTAKTPTQKLAELVAQRKAAAAGGGRDIPGKRSAERGAAHLSASKSKPALRKT